MQSIVLPQVCILGGGEEERVVLKCIGACERYCTYECEGGMYVAIASRSSCL